MPCNSPPLDRSSLNDSFAQSLQHALIRKFKRVPAASTFANAFNAHTNHIQNINPETARKWIAGKSIPEFDRLIILKDWLKLDLNGFGKPPEEINLAQSLLPSEPHIDRIKELHRKEFEELETQLHDALANFAIRLR
jgi:hypothetical protein